eukprot:TRINITY_DN58894_c0_g1_i2.p1 TRINITY_DN58894_c0_g1~~TRINITY_DN58894_c0_g1_i2.p1  ORF type:complete len:213 (-),score=34.99 TRINITY_DN58894_c0_g1_i2:226-864(-)
MYKEIALLGKTVKWTADISQAGCGCNAAFYMTHMPGYKKDGKPDPEKGGDYYCDANDVGGNWCPEMDLQEANQHALKMTPHKCDAPQNKHFGGCDRSGCGKDTNKDATAFGSGQHFTIDTRFPYNVSVQFQESGGKLVKVVGTISQGHKSISVDPPCDSSYLQTLGEQIQGGMVFIASYWGDTMNWLDVPPCDKAARCDHHTTVSFSGISVE